MRTILFCGTTQVLCSFFLCFMMQQMSWSLVVRRTLRFHPRSITSRSVSDANTGAYLNAKNSSTAMPCIILVNPFSASNVGSVSRAMLNFGLHELRIVQPRCDVLGDEATTLAVGSVEILKNAKIYASIAECISDLEVVVATTARKHTINQIVQTPAEAAAEMITATNSCKAGIMFGRERDGLTGDELALANRRVAIPTYERFGVLNLAQAVNVLAYECFLQKLRVESAQLQSSEHTLNMQGPDEAWSESEDDETRPDRIFQPNRLATTAEFSNLMHRLFTEMGKSQRYGNARRLAKWERKAEQRAQRGESQVPVTNEVTGISGMRLNNEARIAALFQRAKLNKAELRLLHGAISRLTQ